jgi:mannose-6-phosphate isomerase-like protein (cupin superfamily)
VTDRVNLDEAFAQLDQPFRPLVVAEFNENKVMVARTQGEFVWHRHDDTDDLFIVLRGSLTIQLRDREVVLGPGELYVVPRGVEHCPRSDEGAELLLIEPLGTVNTGDAEPSELTAPERRL